MDLTQLRLRTRFDDFEVSEPRLPNQTVQFWHVRGVQITNNYGYPIKRDKHCQVTEVQIKKKKKKSRLTISTNWFIYLTFFTIILFFKKNIF